MSPRLPRAGSLLVCYQGVPAALVSLRQISFVGNVRQLLPGDPTVRMVACMAYYAQLVLAGEIPGSYSDKAGERFARLALIDPTDPHPAPSRERRDARCPLPRSARRNQPCPPRAEQPRCELN